MLIPRSRKLTFLTPFSTKNLIEGYRLLRKARKSATISKGPSQTQKILSIYLRHKMTRGRRVDQIDRMMSNSNLSINTSEMRDPNGEPMGTPMFAVRRYTDLLNWQTSKERQLLMRRINSFMKSLKTVIILRTTLKCAMVGFQVEHGEIGGWH